MRLAREQVFDAVVLHLRGVGESHRVIELLTREQGRLSVLVRGARTSRRRFIGGLDLFVRLRARVLARGTLWTLQSAEVLDQRLGIRGALDRYARASRLCECVRVLAPERHLVPGMYEALTAGLDALHAGLRAQASLTYARVLEAAGLLPDVGACSACGRRDVDVGLESGGAVCAVCGPGRDLLPRATRLALCDGVCEDEAVGVDVERRLVALVEHHAGRPLRSRLALSA